MKYNNTIIINKPRNIVVDAFFDPESLKYSQNGFIKKELIKGQPNEVGSVSKLIYKKFEMTETIMSNDIPNRFSGRYDHKNMSNTMVCYFEAIDNSSTKFTSEIEYTHFNGFVIKMIARIFPGMFKKQIDTWLTKFKTYVESI